MCPALYLIVAVTRISLAPEWLRGLQDTPLLPHFLLLPLGSGLVPWQPRSRKAERDY